MTIYKYSNSDIYKQLEELMHKTDKMQSEIKELKEENRELRKYKEEALFLRKENKQLKAKIVKLEATIDKLEEKIKKLENKNDKNSSNSSKPPSQDIVSIKKKSGANLYNGRVSSDKTIGGQVGHKGDTLTKEKIEKVIRDKKLKIKKIIHFIKGNESKAPLIKYKIGLESRVIIEKHIFKYQKEAKEKLSPAFYSDVTYDNNIKALAIELCCYDIVPYNKIQDFFNVMSEGVIKISQGTLVNFLKDFGDKSKEEIEKLVEELLKSKTIYTDETVTKFNKKNLFIRNYSNDNTTVYIPRLTKGHKTIKEDNILPIYQGGIMGDHDTTLHSYGNENYECNVHILRYLEEIIQCNQDSVLWVRQMKELLIRMNNTRKIAFMYGLENFDEEKINEYIKEYDDILIFAKIEDRENKNMIYSDKAEKLRRRLVKYKESHLAFIKNFEIAFDNNLSERDLRIFKSKTKVSGGFRSYLLSKCYSNALSIIKTSIKRNFNPFNSIKAIFNNDKLFV